MQTFPFATHNASVLTVERPKRALQRLLEAHDHHYHCTSVGDSVLGSMRANDQLWLHASALLHLRAYSGPLLTDYARSGRASCASCTAAFRNTPSATAPPLVRCDALYQNAPLALRTWQNLSRP